MYAQLQQKAKKYIIDSMCVTSEGWKFDIDTSNENEPVIVGYGPSDIEIRSAIENFNNCFPKEVVAKIMKTYKLTFSDSDKYLGYYIIKKWILDVLKIYGINAVYLSSWRRTFTIKSKYSSQEIESSIRCNIGYDTQLPYFVSPFMERSLVECLLKEQLVSSMLLLLDPIKYFRKYSIIIHKYPELNIGHTLGIYELLLEYFPEIVQGVVMKCWMVQGVFWDLATDIGELVIERMIDLL